MNVITIPVKLWKCPSYFKQDILDEKIKLKKSVFNLLFRKFMSDFIWAGPFFCCNGLPYTGHMEPLLTIHMCTDRVIVG